MVESWSWKLVWKTKLPRKMICFTWTALYKACFPEDYLTHCREMLHVQTMYRNQQLLLHCSVAREIWNMFFLVFGLNWVMPKRIKDAYICCVALESWKSGQENLENGPCLYFLVNLDRKEHICFDGAATPNHILKDCCYFPAN